MKILHEDSRSALALDRLPIRWQEGRARGFAWSERVEPVEERLRSWEEAATIGAACGLVLDGRRRFVHASVAGIAPVYFLASEGAVYFASAIDALARTSPRPLSVDWDAWASILTLDHPLGDRTPFAEIRRLSPYSLLNCQRGKARVSEKRWAWAEVEPRLGVEEGADAVLARMRASVARLPAGPLICPLSGGWDSRILLLLFAEDRREDVTAFTYGSDRDLDGRFAPAVAALIGVPHELVAGDERRYWHDLERRFERTDYQQPLAPWTMTLNDRLRGVPGTVTDGFGFDSLAQPGVFVTAEASAAGGSGEAARAMWRRLMEFGQQGGARAFSRRFGRAITAVTRRQFVAETRRFAGHPARAVLSNYWTRAVRGTSLRPAAIWGADLVVATPFTDHTLVTELLAINPQLAWNGKVYAALFARLSPEIAALPSTHDPDPPSPPPRPASSRQDRSAAGVVAGYNERLGAGPLAPFLSRQGRRRLERAAAGLPARVPVGARGPIVFHAWCDRYRDLLGDVDPGAAFGVGPEPLRRE